MLRLCDVQADSAMEIPSQKLVCEALHPKLNPKPQTLNTKTLNPKATFEKRTTSSLYVPLVYLYVYGMDLHRCCYT